MNSISKSVTFKKVRGGLIMREKNEEAVGDADEISRDFKSFFADNLQKLEVGREYNVTLSFEEVAREAPER